MANFYGSYIGYGASAGGAAIAGWYGPRGTAFGGYYPNRNDIDYITIANTGGTALDFGDIITAVRGTESFGNGIGGRGVCVGGSTDSGQGNGGAASSPGLQYITFASTSNATFFGNLVVGAYVPGYGQDATWGMKVGGEGGSPYYNGTIDYVVTATTGDADDWGDMHVAGARSASVNDTTTCLTANMWWSPGGFTNMIMHMTVKTLGSSVDWGWNRTVSVYSGTACSSDSGRGVWAGGNDTVGKQNVLDYVTIQTGADALDFGNMVAPRADQAGYGNGTRGCFAGSYPSTAAIDYVTLATTGDAQDFGDLLVGRSYFGGCAGT